MLLSSIRVVGGSRPANYTIIYHLRRYIIRYLLITFIRKPTGQIDEQIQVSKKIKPADLQTCNIILDFASKKVEKSVIEGKKIETDWEKMHTYYSQIYPSLITQLEKEAPITAKAKQ